MRAMTTSQEVKALIKKRRERIQGDIHFSNLVIESLISQLRAEGWQPSGTLELVSDKQNVMVTANIALNVYKQGDYTCHISLDIEREQNAIPAFTISLTGVDALPNPKPKRMGFSRNLVELTPSLITWFYGELFKTVGWAEGTVHPS